MKQEKYESNTQLIQESLKLSGLLTPTKILQSLSLIKGGDLSQQLSGQVAGSERPPDSSHQDAPDNSSQRSKEDTKNLYKKLTRMGGITASLMSVKKDYTTLDKQLKSPKSQQQIQQAHKEIKEQYEQKKKQSGQKLKSPRSPNQLSPSCNLKISITDEIQGAADQRTPDQRTPDQPIPDK